MVRKHPKLEQYSNAEKASDSEVLGLIKKINVSPDPGFNAMPVDVADDDPLAGVLRTRGHYYRAEIDVHMKDGSTISKAADYWKGHSRKPLALEDLIEKYWDNVEYGSGIVSKEVAKEVLDKILHIEDVQSSTDYIALLRG